MLFSLAVAVAFVVFMILLFLGIGKAYSSVASSINSSYADAGNALAQEVQPYSEFHIIAPNS